MSACVNLSGAQIPRLVLQCDRGCARPVPDARTQPKKKYQPGKKIWFLARWVRLERVDPGAFAKGSVIVKRDGGKIQIKCTRERELVRSVRARRCGCGVSGRSRWRWRAPPAGLVGTRGGTPPPSLQSSGGGIYSQRQLISCAPPFAPRPLQTQIRGSPQNSAAAYFWQLHIFCLIFFSLQNCLRALLKVAVAADCAKVGKLGLFGRWTRFSHLSIAARSRVLRLSDGKVFTWFVSVNFEWSFLSSD